MQISNDGMASLTAFQRLSCLTLEGCIGVSDAGIAHIVTLQHLTDLDFGAGDDITDSVRLACWSAICPRHMCAVPNPAAWDNRSCCCV